MLGPEDRDEPTVGVDEDFKVLPEARRKVDADLTAARYVALPPARKLPADGVENIAGFTLRFAHTQVDEGGENMAPRYDVTMVISHGNKKPSIISQTGSIACAEPIVQVRELRGVGLLVEQICHIADEGEYGVSAQAWLCVGTDCH